MNSNVSGRAAAGGAGGSAQVVGSRSEATSFRDAACDQFTSCLGGSTSRAMCSNALSADRGDVLFSNLQYSRYLQKTLILASLEL